MRFDVSEQVTSLGLDKELNKLVSDLGDGDADPDTESTARAAIAQAEKSLSSRVSSLKKTNWEGLLEERRDGVVQLMVVQENYLWSKGYRQPILEEIFGSG